MRKSPGWDVAVIGAGVFGLACALACALRGRSVIVLERAHPGAGASGGLVGALAPHPPDRWSAKKALQLEALLEAEAFWASVAAIGGGDPGYRRLGRLIPLRDDRERALAEVRAAGAATHWGVRARWSVLDRASLPAWIDRDAAPCGAVRETLSARLNPRAAVAALAAAVAASGGEMRLAAAQAIKGGRVRLADGDAVSASVVVLAAGEGSARLLGPAAAAAMGRGVKGQAALVDPGPGGAPPEMLYCDGLYVVPQPGGMVAIGSTSETDWRDPQSVDAGLYALIERAGRVCPGLTGARVIERWAGVRPRGALPEPVAGPAPGMPGVLIAGGGYRTGFTFAPQVGRFVAALIDGDRPIPTGGVAPERHVAAVDGRRSRPD